MSVVQNVRVRCSDSLLPGLVAVMEFEGFAAAAPTRGRGRAGATFAVPQERATKFADVLHGIVVTAVIMEGDARGWPPDGRVLPVPLPIERARALIEMVRSRFKGRVVAASLSVEADGTDKPGDPDNVVFGAVCDAPEVADEIRGWIARSGLHS